MIKNKKVTRVPTLEWIGKVCPKAKRSQVWSLDLIVAIIIFLSGIVVLYFYAINYTSDSRARLDDLFYDGNLASELILTNEDYGILTSGKINQTKLENFYNLEYGQKKAYLGMRYDFYFEFEGMEIGGMPVDYVGLFNSGDAENIVQITRIAIYRNKPIKFNLFVFY